MECVATVYIINDQDQFLMMYNQKQKAWLPAGGFAFPDELIHECAIRETKEEIGEQIGQNLTFMGNVAFDTNDLDSRTKISPTPLFVAKQTLTNGKIVENFIYLAKTKVLSIEEKTYQAKWFNNSEIDTIDTFENVKIQFHYILDHINNFKSFPNDIK